MRKLASILSIIAVATLIAEVATAGTLSGATLAIQVPGAQVGSPGSGSR